MKIKVLSTILISIPLLAACDIGRELAKVAIDVDKKSPNRNRKTSYGLIFL